VKRFSAFFLAFMLPVLALGEPVAVVSGEHEGYTRLVLSISPDREWELFVDQNSASLVFTSQKLEFDDSKVFARIAKTRLVSTFSEQSETAAKYTMNIGCDCEVNAFAYLEKYIVVDIVDRPETTINTPPARNFTPKSRAISKPDGNDRPPEIVSWIRPRAPYYVSSPDRVNFPLQMDGSGLAQTQKPDAPPRVSRTDRVREVPSATIQTDRELQEAVDVARNSLLQQLTLAADQGLLDLNRPSPEIVQEVAQEEFPAIFEEEEDETQILIQTVLVRDALAARGGRNLQNDRCPSPEDLDIASWGSGDDFFDELSSARQGLLGEFDEPDFAEVERLIRTYLRYGFGAEARSYLLESRQNIAQYSLLLDIAAIVDGQTVQDGGPLSQAIECGGAASLWALVGVYPAVDAGIDDKPSIVDAFAKLPPDIRRLVGPRLAAAFLDRGFEVIARRVVDILERAPLMQAEGSAPEAAQAFTALANDNSLVATDALIALATLQLTQNQRPPQNLLMDLGTGAKIWRGTQKGGELRRLEALWMAKQGREAEAIDLLVAEIERDSSNADLLRKTAEEILSALSVSEDQSYGYAEVVDTYIGFISENEDAGKLRLEIAAKLLLVGLPDFAIEILRPMLQRNELDAILIGAAANIQAYRPDTAVVLLNGVAGDAARKLRVQAYLGMGDFERALAQLNQFSVRQAAIVRPYWFNGDWEKVVKTNSFAAEIRAQYFPLGGGSSSGTDKLSLNGAIALTALQKLLIDSQARRTDMENVLLQQ